MRALQLDAVERLTLRDLPAPKPAPGWLLIRVEAAGICGTDRHLYLGEFPSQPPVTLGHEFAGIVLAGALPPGTRITADPNIPCHACPQCRAGRVNLCPHNAPLGVGQAGGMAELALVPLAQAHVLPETLDPLHGALVEPLACTLHGIDLGAPRAGERVVVLGGGVIGQMAVQLAALAGAEVLLVTRSETKRALALRLGAAATAASVAEARALWPEGAPLVLECAGVAETVEAAPSLTRAGGRIVILGVLPKGLRVGIEPFDLLFREITLIHSFLNPFTHGRAADLVARGRVQLDPLISRVISLEDAAATIAAPPRPGDVKVLIRP